MCQREKETKSGRQGKKNIWGFYKGYCSMSRIKLQSQGKKLVNGVIVGLPKVIPWVEMENLSLDGASPLHSKYSAPAKPRKAHKWMGSLRFLGCEDPKSSIQAEGKDPVFCSAKGFPTQSSPGCFLAWSSHAVLLGLPLAGINKPHFEAGQVMLPWVQTPGCFALSHLEHWQSLLQDSSS